jgi:hypothetical protein
MDVVLQWKHECTAVLTCNKGCGTQIYFDPNNKSFFMLYSMSLGIMISSKVSLCHKGMRIIKNYIILRLEF